MVLEVYTGTYPTPEWFFVPNVGKKVSMRINNFIVQEVYLTHFNLKLYFHSLVILVIILHYNSHTYITLYS